VYRNPQTRTPVRSTATTGSGGRVSRRPQGKGSAAKGGSAGLKATSHRDPVTVTLQWVGRGEPWVRITRGDETLLRPGTMRLFELVLWLNGWERS
jgi:hypothetical protein